MKKRTSPQDQFNAFHAAHPAFYEAFCKRVDQLWMRGHRHGSADMILHVIRFYSMLDARPGELYKVNNNHAAFYARLWQKDNPDRAAFFETRTQTSISTPRVKQP